MCTGNALYVHVKYFLHSDGQRRDNSDYVLCLLVYVIGTFFGFEVTIKPAYVIVNTSQILELLWLYRFFKGFLSLYILR